MPNREETHTLKTYIKKASVVITSTSKRIQRTSQYINIYITQLNHILKLNPNP